MDVRYAALSIPATTELEVVLMGSTGLDVAETTPANARLLIAGAAPGVAPSSADAPADANGDGRPDRVFRFAMAGLVAAGLAPGTPALTLQDTVSRTRFRAADATPTRFSGGPVALQKTAGDGGSSPSGTPRPVRVRVVDAAGGGVPGVSVAWSVSVGAGTLAQSTTQTDVDGFAATTWMLGAGSGGQRLAVAAGALGASFYALVPAAGGAAITVEPQVNAAATVTTPLDSLGGSVTLALTSGLRYTLEVPAGALVDPTPITLTALSAIPNLPLSGGARAGVRMTPAGLRFTRPARLRVEFPAGTVMRPLIGFGYEGSGTDFRLTPSRIEGTALVMSIAHFSGAGAGEGTAEDAAALLPTGPIASQRFAETALAVLEEQAAGESPDPAAVANVLRQWWQGGVRPGLQAAGTDDEAVDEALTDYAAWLALVQRYGVDLQAENTEALGLITTALKHAVQQHLATCTANRDLAAGERAFKRITQARQLGVESEANGLSHAAVVAEFCATPSTPRPGPQRISRGQTATLPFRPALQFRASPAAARGPAGGARFSMAAADEQVPVRVTVTLAGSTQDGPREATVAPGGELSVPVQAADGQARVTATVRSCLRDPARPRLDHICRDEQFSYPVGSPLTGTWEVYLINGDSAQWAESLLYFTGGWIITIDDEGSVPVARWEWWVGTTRIRLVLFPDLHRGSGAGVGTLVCNDATAYDHDGTSGRFGESYFTFRPTSPSADGRERIELTQSIPTRTDLLVWTARRLP